MKIAKIDKIVRNRPYWLKLAEINRNRQEGHLIEIYESTETDHIDRNRQKSPKSTKSDGIIRLTKIDLFGEN